ncbi:MAG: Hsp20/alpha crystallin family protein [Clostridiales bacterium]|nr:Hsp20/alpha crystallin family protein [Clostridiales bacterium]MCF8023091.1 Hsp20/alpha crystallin family protein [Clostridiales bacterium]
MSDSTKLLKQVISMLNKNQEDIPSKKNDYVNNNVIEAEVQETNEEIHITMEIPGVQSREDFGFFITSTHLTIHGRRQKIINDDTDNTSAKKKKIKFEKNFKLSNPIRPETASAEYSKGILTLKLTKKKETPYKNIYVHFIP